MHPGIGCKVACVCVCARARRSVGGDVILVCENKVLLHRVRVAATATVSIC